MIDRVGLKLMLMERSSVSATVIATAITLAIPKKLLILSMLGKAKIISAARIPPMMINGFLRPPQNQALSLINPMMGCPRIPAMGPAAHTIPIWSISRLYFVLRIQLKTAIWIDKANPIAVLGKPRIM